MKYILLFGMPRSGTTWIGKTFDSHPGTLYLHEPDSVSGLQLLPLLPAIEDTDKYKDVVNIFMSNMTEQSSPKVTGKLPIFRKEYMNEMQYQSRRLKLFASKFTAHMGIELSIPPVYKKGKSDKISVVWKSIESLGRLGLILDLIENSIAIHIIRHPCGYVASVVRGEQQGRFGSEVLASEDYDLMRMLLATDQAKEYGLSMELISGMHPYERLAWRWVLFNEKAMDEVSNCANSMMIRYEDVCADPVGNFKRLFEFCGLGWCDQSEKFVCASTSGSGSSYYGVYKNPVRSANHWKEYLDDAAIRRIMNVVVKTRIGAAYSEDFVSESA